MKKVFFLLMMMCIVFTGCKKDQNAGQELNIENHSVQTEINEESAITLTERTSTTTAVTAETTDSGTSTNQTSSSTGQSQTTVITTAIKEVPLDAGNALKKAVMDEEERAAIAAVQPSEQLNYYKSPDLDFDLDGYANLNISGYGFALLSSGSGSNVHQYFFESKPLR